MYILIMNGEAKIASNSRTKIKEWSKKFYGEKVFDFVNIAFSTEMKALHGDRVLGHIREIEVL